MINKITSINEQLQYMKNRLIASFLKGTLLALAVFQPIVGVFAAPCGANGVDSDITTKDFGIELCQLDPVNQATEDIPGGSDAVTMLLEKIATFLIFLVPLIAGVSLVIAGYYYILSSGDSEKASRAKTIIKWNGVAILLTLFSYTIIATIASLLDANI